jgi:hypothetical protein
MAVDPLYLHRGTRGTGQHVDVCPVLRLRKRPGHDDDPGNAPTSFK